MPRIGGMIDQLGKVSFTSKLQSVLAVPVVTDSSVCSNAYEKQA